MKIIYKAIAQDGSVKTGELDAKSITEAAKYLKSRKLVPVSLKEKSESLLVMLLAPFHRVTSSDVVYFTRQLASMLVSGLTLIQALSLLKDQVKSQSMKTIVNGIITDIEEGSSFSIALSKYSEVFSAVYIASIRAGEQAGILDKVLLRLADNLEKKERLKATIKSALLYPAIVIAGMIVVAAIMMLFVIPQIGALYKDLSVDLPLPTRIVIFISDSFVFLWPFLLIFIFGIPAGLRMWHKSESGKRVLDKIVLKLPIFGSLIEKTIIAEFTRTMGVLIGSGTLVVDALRQAASATGNVYYQEAIIEVSKKVEKGISMGDAMTASPYFPAIVDQMTKIGEETGKVDESFLKVSDYFDQEIDHDVKNLTTAMEPLIMIILGVGVGFLVFAIIAPIYNLVSIIG